MSQYDASKPKQLFDYYIFFGTDKAYQEAGELLHERYGNENVVSTAFTSKLRSWPKINGKDPNSLRMFSDFLLKLITAKKTTQSLHVLDFVKEIVELLEKLSCS